MLTRTSLSASLFLVNGRIPDGARMVSDRAVKNDAHPIGAALIQFSETGIYALCSSAKISSVNQHEAAAIDAYEKLEAKKEANNG